MKLIPHWPKNPGAAAHLSRIAADLQAAHIQQTLKAIKLPKAQKLALLDDIIKACPFPTVRQQSTQE